MRVPDGKQILRIWEDGQGATPAQLSMALLSAAFPDRPMGQLLDMSVGQRDAYLMLLRERMLGSAAAGQAICPKCRLKVEFEFDITAFLTSTILEEEIGTPARTFLWKGEGGWEIEFRRLTTGDLLRMPARAGIGPASESLVRASLLGAACNGLSVDTESVPDEIISAVGEAIHESDPESYIEVSLVCPGCDHPWRLPFDPPRFIYKEISSQAERMLYEIHLMARAYGWSEQEVLALSPARRRMYMEMAGK